VDDLWATKREDVGLIVRAISKIFNLCGHDPTTIVHCAVKTNLRRMSNLASPPELQMLQSFQLHEVLPPDSPPGQSHARHDQGSSPPPKYNILASP